ncbi:helix-turn-helix domain-containing protein [Achromobacter xylosoxidans]
MKDRTDFGVSLRVMRAKNNETLGGMAKKLGVSSAFLSSIETGSKPVPTKVLSALAERYALDKAKLDNLRALAAESMAEFHLVPKKEDRALVSIFSNKLSEMTPSEKEKLKAFLLGSGGKE